MSQPTTPPDDIAGKITESGNIRSRFDMFIVLTPAAYTSSRKKTKTWCHRGDKFTDDPAKMLCNLVKLFGNHFGKYQLAELYDNTRPKNDPERIVVRYKDGIVETNRLHVYAPMLQQIVIPPILQI